MLKLVTIAVLLRERFGELSSPKIAILSSPNRRCKLLPWRSQTE
jgi:hypothetical protein